MLPVAKCLRSCKASVLPGRFVSVCVSLRKTFDVTSEKDFNDKVLSSAIPVVVDFHAEWCGPCVQLGPLLNDAMKPVADSVNLARVDVDKLGDVAMKYNVTALPTVIAVKQGKIVDKFVGLQNSTFVSKFVQQLNND